MVLSILSCVIITTVNFKTFHCLKKKFESFLSHTQRPVYYQHQSTRFPYSGLHGNGTLQCVGFCVWLLSLSVTSSRFICGSMRPCFIFMAEKQSVVRLDRMWPVCPRRTFGLPPRFGYHE